MKVFSFFVLIIILSACSTAKQLNKKWVGKTDQDVVNEYGLPKHVLANNIKGKIYIYKPVPSKLGNTFVVTRSSSTETTKVRPQTITSEKTTFHFDSLNKVYLVEFKDSSYTD